MSNVSVEWRNLNVRRNRKYMHLQERLCSAKNRFTRKPLFEFNKDLMVFAAVLGYQFGLKEAIESDSVPITLGIYASDEKDGFIYLLGLLATKETGILKDERLSDCIKIFEEYCNGGLKYLDSLLKENVQDTEGVDTLSDLIIEQLKKSVPDTEDNLPSINFS